MLVFQILAPATHQRVATHADRAMDAPERRSDSGPTERAIPGYCVVGVCVDESAVDIEDEGVAHSRFSFVRGAGMTQRVPNDRRMHAVAAYASAMTSTCFGAWWP
jgi:hypothetical protein